MPGWGVAVVVLGVFRIVAALILYLSGLNSPLSRPLAPLWVYALLSLSFMIAGLALVLSQRRDRRAEWLGAMLILVGCPLVRPLIAGDGPASLAWLEYLRPEVFTPACGWSFAACFPSPLTGRTARVVQGISAACAVIGAVLLILGVASAQVAGRAPSIALVLGEVPGKVSAVWLVIFGLSAPSQVVMVWRSLVAVSEDSASAARFIRALACGVGPITLEVLVEGLWPAYGRFMHTPATEPWITAAVFLPLGTLPFLAAYAVLFDRVVDTHIALRAAAQYLLARYIFAILTLIPIGGLLFFLVRHREESLISLFSGGARPAVLLGCGLGGVAALQWRPRVIRALDRRYHREAYDGSRIVERVTGALDVTSTRELGARVQREIADALHATTIVFLLDSQQSVLCTDDGVARTLPLFTPWLRLGESGIATLDLLSDDGKTMLASLPATERQWATELGIRLVTCVRSPATGPIGLIGVGARLSDLPYSTADRRFLSTMASATGLAFDSLRLRHIQAAPVEPSALECDGCGSVFPPVATRCHCGRSLSPGVIPHVLRGVFRFERRLGSGGGGTVYRAADLALGRTVAIKVLSGASPDLTDALIAEARNMAGMTHRHLAVVYGVERWRGAPLLVQEFLAGGTLAQRLQAGRLPHEDVLQLGEVLADVLDRLHGQGVVHRDIKPSNIGYTGEGTVKLFDFGLATQLSATYARTAPRLLGDAGNGSTSAHAPIVGTPFYMSPEAIRGDGASPAADWWALSVVLFEALTGRRPFDGSDAAEVMTSVLYKPLPALRAFRPELPAPLEQFFLSSFDRERGNRPAGGRAFHAAMSGLRAVHGQQH